MKHRAIQITAAFVSLVVAFPVAAQEIVPYPQGGVALGSGWDSLRQTKTATNCVIADRANDPGEKRDITYGVVVDTASLFESLTASASAKVSGVLGNVSGSAKYARETKFDQETHTIRFKAFRLFGAEYLVPPGATAGLSGRPELWGPRETRMRPEIADFPGAITLRSEYAEMARTDPLKFQRVCGDGFVRSVYSQISLVGTYSFRAVSKQEREELTAELSGGFLAFSGSGKANTLTQRYHRESRLNVSYSQLGGSDLPFATGDAEVRELVRKIGVSPVTGATRIEMEVGSYRDLPNYPDSTNNKYAVLERLANRWLELRYLADLLDQPIRNPEKYVLESVSMQGMRNDQDAMYAEMEALKAEISACVANSSACPPSSRTVSRDYQYRMRLPLTKTISVGWAAITSAETKLASAQRTLDATPRTRRVQIRIGSLVGYRDERNPDYDRALDARDDAQFYLDRAKEMLRHDDAWQRFDVFIDNVARVRRSNGSPAGLTNAELDVINQQMVPGVNTIDRRPPSECRRIGLCPRP